MRTFHNFASALLMIVIGVTTPGASGQSQLSSVEPSALTQARRQVVAYIAKLADIHCTEAVTQEKFAKNGHTEASEVSTYDYLVMMQGSDNDFQLNESRIASSSTRHKALPLLVTNGFSTLLLVFHPFYQDSFSMISGASEVLDGKRRIPIRFSHIPGTRTPAALALRGREYPLDLVGTAWLDQESGEVVSIEASLLRDMSDVGLRSMTIHVEYKPVNLGKEGTMILPSFATIDVETPRQRWRNTHRFTEYKSFSTEAEQDKSVKVRSSEDALPEAKPDPKEKP